eukprot:6074543-Prymnesium_polylepis.1
MLTKAYDLGIDVGKLSDAEKGFYEVEMAINKGGRRMPPLLPDDFAEELKAKSFTNGKEDRPMVGALYRTAFEMQMSEATKLMYCGLGWGDAEMVLVTKVVASGAMAKLEELNLNNNRIGDKGMKSFSIALASGAMVQLKVLYLAANKIGDEGMVSFSTALASGAMAQLTVLYLANNQIGNEGMTSFSAPWLSLNISQLTSLLMSSRRSVSSVALTCEPRQRRDGETQESLHIWQSSE